MNVQVDAFNVEYRLLVKPTVTIGRLLEHLTAPGRGHLLVDTRHHHHHHLKHLFGLQVFNERQLTTVWADPRLSLAAAIRREGIAFQPTAIRFRLRAQAFPPSLEALQGDGTALELLYRQAAAKLLKAVAKKRKKKEQQEKRNFFDPAFLATLVALSLLIDYGPFVVAEASVVEEEDGDNDDGGSGSFAPLKEATARATALGVSSLPSFGEEQEEEEEEEEVTPAQAQAKTGKAILALWRLFGLMTAAEAQYNYLSLLASSEEYSVETVRFAVVPLYSDVEEVKTLLKKKKKEVKRGNDEEEEEVKVVVRLAVSYQGVEVTTTTTTKKSSVEQLEETSLALDWSAIDRFENHKRRLKIVLADATTAAEKEEEKEKSIWALVLAFAGKPKKKVVILAASSAYEAHLIFQLIVAYHGEHCRRVWRSNNNGCGRRTMEGGGGGANFTAEARFVLPQPEHFFGRLLSSTLQLEHLKQKLEKLEKLRLVAEDVDYSEEEAKEEEEEGKEAEKEEKVEEEPEEEKEEGSGVLLVEEEDQEGEVLESLLSCLQAKMMAVDTSSPSSSSSPLVSSEPSPSVTKEAEEDKEEISKDNSNNKKNHIHNSSSNSSGLGDLDLLSTA